MSLASSSSEQSPEPLFDLHDLHGQAALHVAARLGQAQVVKVGIVFEFLSVFCRARVESR
jgi:ankyrin repeat protein